MEAASLKVAFVAKLDELLELFIAAKDDDKKMFYYKFVKFKSVHNKAMSSFDELRVFRMPYLIPRVHHEDGNANSHAVCQ